MKTIILTFVIICLGCSISKAQFKQGDWELGFIGSFGSLEITQKYSNSYYGTHFSTYNGNHSESRSYAIVSITPAFYIVDGLSIEPELGLVALEKVSPAQFIIGNLSYTYQLPNSNFALFGRAGYGISNSILFTYNDIPFNRLTTDMDIKLINLGAGFKYLVSSSVILKTEINYLIQKYENNYTSDYSSTTNKYEYDHISLLFGFSVLL